MQKAIFLDRDGVINSDVGHYYIYKVKDFVINDGIITSLKKFINEGYILFVITNQGGVAKGIYTCQEVEKVHQHLLNILSENDIAIKQIYYCPHHQSIKACDCRKPSPYMINKAIEKYNIDKDSSFMIGDSKRDIESAIAAGIKGILINKNENIEKYCKKIINNEY